MSADLYPMFGCALFVGLGFYAWHRAKVAIDAAESAAVELADVALAAAAQLQTVYQGHAEALGAAHTERAMQLGLQQAHLQNDLILVHNQAMLRVEQILRDNA